MTINYPREITWDAEAVLSISGLFDIQRVDYQSADLSGRIGGVTAGFPLWTASWDVKAIDLASGDYVQAWINSLRGSQKQFYGRDIGRTYPRLYRGGFAGLNRAPGGDFDGHASSWEIDGTGSVLTLNGLPAGFTLVQGDYVGFAWGSTQTTMVRVLEAFGASGAGTLTVTVEPSVPTVVPADAVASVFGAKCLMKLTSATAIQSRTNLREFTATIAAIQDLIA